MVTEPRGTTTVKLVTACPECRGAVLYLHIVDGVPYPVATCCGCGFRWNLMTGTEHKG